MGEELSDRLRISMKFERFMNKVRYDNQPGINLDNLKDESQKPKVIGYFNYNFKNKTETYTPINSDN